MAVAEHTDELDEQPIFWRRAPGSDLGERAPILYLHGVPDSSDTWVPFLERTGGIAPDLPGFGRSGKRGDFDYSIPGYDRWLERFLDHAGVQRVRMVVHDWGAVGLILAQRRPDRVAAPSLVLWGEEDPYLAPRFADAYAGALPNARLRRVAGAGHWPWLDVPQLVDEICSFVDPSTSGP